MKARLKINLTDAILFKDTYGFEKPVSGNYIFFRKDSIVDYEFSKLNVIIRNKSMTFIISQTLFNKSFITIAEERNSILEKILEK